MLSENIFRYRRSLGLTQEALAEKLGVTRQTVSKWEGGQSTPDVEKLIALADCFGITVDELIRGREFSEPKPDGEEKDVTKGPEKLTGSVLVGFLLLLSGILGLTVTGLVWLTDPEAIAVINASSELTINGSGLIFCVCVLGILFGVNLVLNQD